MLVWNACRHCGSSKLFALLHTLNIKTSLSQVSCFSTLTASTIHTTQLPDLHWQWSSTSSGTKLPVRTTAVETWAGEKKRKTFHSSSTAEGYKSGPGTPSWKYVNIQSKTVPKPPKGTRLPRFYVPTEVVRDAHEGSVFQLSESETKHALRVLRMSEGAWLEVCDGKGLLVEAQLRGLTYSNKAFATASANPQQVSWEGPRWEVVAALGGLKGGRADTLVEKVSELGARSLRPLLTHRSRTIGRFEEKSEIRVVEVEELSDMSELEEAEDFAATGRMARWERVSMAAGKQSLRAHALIIRPPCLLESVIPLVQSGAPAFLAAQGAPPLQEVLSASGDSLAAASEPGSNKPCLLLVGPEGDFTEQEVKELQAAGARPVGLGPNRLRVETAAIAMVTGAMLHFEQIKEQTRVQSKAELAA